MALRIDPSEVLAHLNRMGFCGITAEQLRDFISDLRKLIKYDLRQCTCNKEKTSKEEHSGLFVDMSSIASSSDFKRSSDEDDNKIIVNYMNNAEEFDQTDETLYKNLVVGNCASSSTEGFSGKPSEKQRRKVADRGVSNQRKPDKPENNREGQRPRSSFIKSWRVQGPQAPRRSDPVALYHKYQMIWQRQKVPGDNAHVDLRWTIREKMLGEHPQNRPTSRTSSVEPPRRQHKTYDQYNAA